VPNPILQLLLIRIRSTGATSVVPCRVDKTISPVSFPVIDVIITPISQHELDKARGAYPNPIP
jgi:hypothetical protein